ncbi:hypothetical protein EVAR_8620_1 [Eumeta japonica]|uniref:RNA-directed DNA polymerase from transposon X-element n=1 Tax=Eumeta variegata TaxID=151549 RepID=A0A4C1XED4_EUMVA|nr:hypothetical protein EVAR_8620_1 [Eumeta japonica]
MHRTRPHSNPSTLNLSFCSPDLAPLLSWKVLQESYGSDHFPVITKLLFFRPSPKKMIPLLKYKLKDADWNGYRDRLGHRFAKLPKLSASDSTSSADALSQTMLSVADDMFPLKKHSVMGIPFPPW